MSNYAISLKRTSALAAALAFMAVFFVANFASIFSAKADAAQLSTRSLTLSSTLSGTEVGGGVAEAPDNGSEATHTFRFTPITTNAATVTFQYCTDAVGACTTPNGLSMSATPTVGTGGGTAAYLTGTVTWTPAGNLTTSAVTVSFTNIVNPTYDPAPGAADDNTFFVRIVTSVGDDGTVASAVTEGIVITSRVAETLGFSTTGDLIDPGTDPDGVVPAGQNCAPLVGSGAITIGDPTANTLSISSTFDNYSGFRVYTNAAGATLIQYRGDTLRRNGTTDIDAIGGTAADSAVGDEQFGLAVDQTAGGTSPAITSSDDPVNLTEFQTGTANAFGGGAGAGGVTVETAYRVGAGTIVDQGVAEFAFIGDADSNVDPNLAMPPQTIAQGNGYITCASVPIRYIANIDPLTPAGTYTTTIVYSAVPTY